MIVHCPDCSSKYEIAATKIPPGGIQVRCPRCKAVFPIRSVGEDEPVPVLSAVPRSTPEPVRDPGPVAARPAPSPLPEAPSRLVTVQETPRAREPRLVTDPAVAARMARAMVHEVVLPRKVEHNAALRDGTLLSRFGAALARAMTLYEERVSPDLPDRDAYFRDAVNDILGGGKRVL